MSWLTIGACLIRKVRSKPTHFTGVYHAVDKPKHTSTASLHHSTPCPQRPIRLQVGLFTHQLQTVDAILPAHTVLIPLVKPSTGLTGLTSNSSGRTPTTISFSIATSWANLGRSSAQGSQQLRITVYLGEGRGREGEGRRGGGEGRGGEGGEGRGRGREGKGQGRRGEMGGEWRREKRGGEGRGGEGRGGDIKRCHTLHQHCSGSTAHRHSYLCTPHGKRSQGRETYKHSGQFLGRGSRCPSLSRRTSS